MNMDLNDKEPRHSKTHARSPNATIPQYETWRKQTKTPNKQKQNKTNPKQNKTKKLSTDLSLYCQILHWTRSS